MTRSEIVPLYFTSDRPLIPVIRLSNGTYHLKRTPLTALRGFLRERSVIYPVIVLVFALFVLAGSLVPTSWLVVGLAFLGPLLLSQAIMSFYIYERPGGMAGAKFAGLFLVVSLIIIGLKIRHDKLVAKL